MSTGAWFPNCGSQTEPSALPDISILLSRENSSGHLPSSSINTSSITYHLPPSVAWNMVVLLFTPEDSAVFSSSCSFFSSSAFMQSPKCPRFLFLLAPDTDLFSLSKTHSSVFKENIFGIRDEVFQAVRTSPDSKTLELS